MNRERVMKWLFIVLIGLSVSLPCPAVARQITGTLSRPAGSSTDTAIDVDVSVFPQYQNNYLLATNSIQIPAGQMATSFSLTDSTNNTVGIKYQLRQASMSLAFMDDGYYNGTGSTSATYDYMHLEAGTTDIADVALSLVPALSVSVSVSLPEGGVNPASGTVFSAAYQYSCNDYKQISSKEFAVDSASMSPFSLKVPDNSASFCIGYSTSSSTYYTRGYLGPDGTKALVGDSRSFTINDDLSSLGLVLINGTFISGNVSLPDTATESATVNVQAFEYRNGSCEQYRYYGSDYGKQLSSANSSQPFNVLVPVGTDVCVGYFSDTYNGPVNYVAAGYAAADNKTSAMRSKALSIASGTTDISLELLLGVKFSGVIQLPDDEILQGPNWTYPSIRIYAGVNGQCQTWNTDSLTASADSWEPGTGSTNWSMVIPIEIESFCMNYSLYGLAGYWDEGYYTDDGTVFPSSEASLFSTTTPRSDIDFTVIRAHTATGSITRSDNDPATEPLNIISWWYSPNTGRGYYITIPAGVRSLANSWKYPAVVPYVQLGYGFHTGETPPPGFSPEGYYSTSGTVSDRGSAAQLPSNIDHQNINVEIFYTPISVMTGDVNNDGFLTLIDAILAAQVVAGNTPAVQIFKTADVNNDGKIGLPESIYILDNMANP